MLTQEDLKLIGEEVGKIVEENITPQFENINKRFDSVEGRLTHIESSMVTKSYLDDKMADLEGTVIVRQRKEDRKLNMLIGFLKDSSVPTDDHVHALDEIQVFPKPPIT